MKWYMDTSNLLKKQKKMLAVAAECLNNWRNLQGTLGVYHMHEVVQSILSVNAKAHYSKVVIT